jgi:hypothetical protein
LAAEVTTDAIFMFDFVDGGGSCLRWRIEGKKEDDGVVQIR